MITKRAKNNVTKHRDGSNAYRNLPSSLTELFLEWINDLKGNFKVDWS